MGVVLSLLSSLASALNGLLNYLDGERLRKLGSLEAQQAAMEQNNANLKVALDVESRAPIADDAGLDGLLPPTDRR